MFSTWNMITQISNKIQLAHVWTRVIATSAIFSEKQAIKSPQVAGALSFIIFII
jgi:hypothetical protein